MSGLLLAGTCSEVKKDSSKTQIDSKSESNRPIPIDSLTAKRIAEEVHRELETNTVVRYRQSNENKFMYNAIDSIVPGIRIDSVPENEARAIITEYFDEVRSKNNYLFLTDLSFNHKFESYYDIVIVPINDQLDIVRQVGTWAPNYNLENKDIVDWFKLQSEQIEFDIVIVDIDRIEAYLNAKPVSVKKLAKDIYEFCPDVIDQGHENMTELVETIEKQSYIWFWWD